LPKAELDDLDRGAPEVDLDAVTAAAQAVARFEETSIYHGLSEAGIEGLFDLDGSPSKTLPSEPAKMLEVVTEGMIALSGAGVEGPYLLVLGEAPFGRLASTSEAYPALRQLEELLGVRPAFSHGLEGAVLASTRGGDFVLSLGVDASIGFDRADATHVHLYLTESFTFDVPGPEAVVTFSC